MQIEDSFRVDLPVEEAWAVLLDIERIAPCLPGAQLQEIEGDEYRGIVKVKVGPITAQYKGSARLEQVDADARTAVIQASGRDTRGQGNASATVQVALVPEGDGTRVSIDTDLSITGKVAQFARGVLDEVASKLLAQFADNLAAEVVTPARVESPAEPATDAPAGEPETAAPDAPDPAAAAAISTIRRVEAPEVEPVDLVAVSGASVLKRIVPVGVVVGLVVLLLWGGRAWRRRH